MFTSNATNKYEDSAIISFTVGLYHKYDVCLISKCKCDDSDITKLGNISALFTWTAPEMHVKM